MGSSKSKILEPRPTRFGRRNASPPPPPPVKPICDPLDGVQLTDTIEFVPPFVGGKVIKVYDGDTITVAACVPGTTKPVYRVHVRLNGIDAPEMKSHNEEEKHVAQQAQAALAELILGKRVQLRNTANEKYGRLLADVYIGEIHVNTWMMDHHFAVAYDGGTKEQTFDWVQYRSQRLLGPPVYTTVRFNNDGDEEYSL